MRLDCDTGMIRHFKVGILFLGTVVSGQCSQCTGDHMITTDHYSRGPWLCSCGLFWHGHRPTWCTLQAYFIFQINAHRTRGQAPTLTSQSRLLEASFCMGPPASLYGVLNWLLLVIASLFCAFPSLEAAPLCSNLDNRALLHFTHHFMGQPN